MNNRKQELKKELRKAMTSDTIFVCIGTMNSILDSLGPRIGERLYKAGIPVCGTPKDPYHALTYEKQNIHLDKYYKHSNKIAIDACFCTEFHKLYRTKLSPGSISPGAGVGKKAPSVGNYAIRAYMLLKTESYLLTDSKLNLSGKYKEKVNQLNELVDLISDAIIEVYRELQEWPQIEKLDYDKIEVKYV